MGIDKKVFHWIHQLANQLPAVDTFFIHFTNYGPFLFALLLLALWFSKGEKLRIREVVLFALTVTVLALIFNKMIELMYFRERPFVTEGIAALIDKSAESASFPSNHAAGAFAIAFTLYWRRWTYRFVVLFFALLLAFSRVYVGVHYPGDVVTGALVAFLAFGLVRWQQERLSSLFQSFLSRFHKVEDKLFRRSE